MDDKQLRRNVIDELAFEPSIDAACIDLSGEVGGHHQGTAAEAAVRELFGVVGVFNQSALAAKPTDIKQRIASALARHVKPEADRIDIAVEGATVTITGAVDNWDERFDIERVVWSVKGVRDVVDQLHVA